MSQKGNLLFDLSQHLLMVKSISYHGEDEMTFKVLLSLNY